MCVCTYVYEHIHIHVYTFNFVSFIIFLSESYKVWESVLLSGMGSGACYSASDSYCCLPEQSKDRVSLLSVTTDLCDRSCKKAGKNWPFIPKVDFELPC